VRCFGGIGQYSSLAALAALPVAAWEFVAGRLAGRQRLPALPHHHRNTRSRHRARPPRRHCLTPDPWWCAGSARRGTRPLTDRRSQWITRPGYVSGLEIAQQMGSYGPIVILYMLPFAAAMVLLAVRLWQAATSPERPGRTLEPAGVPA
jgi:hypothetical protein